MAHERILTVDDAAEWRHLLPARVSVFGSVEYARIVQQQMGFAARLFVVDAGESLVVYPFFLRPVNTLLLAADVPGPFWDTASPEYSGPLERRTPAPERQADFADRFSSWSQRHGIVTEFIHLQAFDRRPELLDPGCVFLDRDIVYLDVTLPEERLWAESFSPTCARNIRRAERRGVRVFPATTPDHVRAFHRVYTLSMDHNQAQGKYYFPVEFFLAFFEQMPDHALFLLAEYEGQLVAGGFYLHDDVNVYAHLAGSDRAFRRVCPANAEVREAISWARRQGKQRLILGGGYTREDGIFRFKAGFSPLRANFFVYRRVHLPDTYAALCRAWSLHHRRELPANPFFPAYRTAP